MRLTPTRDKPAFAEIMAFAGCGAALGSAMIAAVLVLAAAVHEGPGVVLGLFIAMGVGVVASIFTAFPLGMMIGWPMFYFLGHSPLHGAVVGLLCAAILWWLGFDLSIGSDDSFDWSYAILFHMSGLLAGWAAYRFSFA